MRKQVIYFQNTGVGLSVIDIPILKGRKWKEERGQPCKMSKHISENSIRCQGLGTILYGWRLYHLGPLLEACAIIMFTLQIRQRRH